MTDPIETLAERVLDECASVDDFGDLPFVRRNYAKATALLRAAIEAERAAAVGAFRELLEPLRKLEAAATPGPWRTLQHNGYWSVVSLDGAVAFDDGSAADEYNKECSDDTRDLIIAFRNTLPALLALTSAPSAGELVRRVRAPLLDALRECHALLGRSAPWAWASGADERTRNEAGDWMNEALGLREKLERLLPSAKDETDG